MDIRIKLMATLMNLGFFFQAVKLMGKLLV